MSAFSYDVDYAKKYGVIKAILASYASILKVSVEDIDISDASRVTGLSTKTICKALDKDETTVSNPVITVAPKSNVFKPKTITPVAPKQKCQADAVCKYLPEMVSNPDLLSALDTWVRVLYKSGKGVTKEQVGLAVDELNEICGDDTSKAINLVTIATQAGYRVFKWCVPTSKYNSQSSNLVHNKQFTPRKSNIIDVVDEGF